VTAVVHALKEHRIDVWVARCGASDRHPRVTAHGPNPLPWTGWENRVTCPGCALPLSERDGPFVAFAVFPPSDPRSAP
jgi:hypothetical protein